MPILRRTVYASQNASGLHFHEHAHVVTGLGLMVEPFAPAQRPMDGSAFVEDSMNRVDEIVLIEPERRNAILSDGGMVLHGGEVWPR